MARPLNNRSTLGVVCVSAESNPATAPVLTAFQMQLRSRHFVPPDRILFGSNTEEVCSALREIPYGRLIVAWNGQPPSWKEWIDDRVAAHLHTIHLWDLTSSFASGSDYPRKGDTAPTRATAEVLRQRQLDKFLKGFYVVPRPPYGLRRVRQNLSGDSTDPKGSPGYVLVPGDTLEIEIIRLVFDLYVNQDLSRTRILGLLRAQQVPPPRNADLWYPRALDSILTDPCYIGANRFGQMTRLNVFPAILEPSLFYAAQSRLSLERAEQSKRPDVPITSTTIQWGRHDG